MSKTIHIEGFAEDIDLAHKLSDNRNLGWSFQYDEESQDSIDNVFFRFYESDEKCSLEEAMEGHIEKMAGKLEATGQEYGYSEVTIEGFNINSLKLGGHDLGKIIKDKEGKYLHILIDVIPKNK